MAADRVRLVRAPLTRAALAAIADGQFGDMVKAVVDVRRGVMAVGGDMHADEEEARIEDAFVRAEIRRIDATWETDA